MVRAILRNVIVMAVVLLLSGGLVLAENDYDQPVSQLDFAVGTYGAIMGQSRSTLNPADSLQILKDRGVVPPNWDGKANVTMGEAQEIFGQLGIQIFAKDPELLISRGEFESILREQLGQFHLTRQHWRITHGFSTELTLGQYRERIISGSGF